MKKRIISLFLALVMIFSVLASVDLSVYASEAQLPSSTGYIDPEIYFAQCMAGVAKDEKSDAVEQCHNLYNYYINENIYSPTQSFLDACYENKSLMKEYDIWKSSSLAADPSSALNMVMKKEDYYESLIIAMYSKATAESNAFQELLKNKIINQSKSIISSLCEIKKITEVSQIVDAVDIKDPETVIALEKCVSATYSLATTKKVCGVVGDVLSYGKDILDVVDRLAYYGSMVELDAATKLWISQMYDSCTSETDAQLKSALKTLSLASTDFAGAALADVKETAFTLTKWGVKETVKVGMAGLAAGNPALAAVFAGLKLGKTVCNIFFATDDVCEQLFTMECIFDVQDLSRRVAESRKNTFIGEQSVENAKAFIYAVDCYYESIINVDIDCMERFLDKLYNGGILSGFIKWVFGATDDYQECVNALEGLREARINNYDNMHTYFKIALQLNYPETYSLYFTLNNTVKVTGIYLPTARIFPTGYPANYANLLVGEFLNISVCYTPTTTTQEGFVATSDNPDVVRIEGNVMVGVSEGTANVTVTSTADPFVFYTAEIVVKNRLEDVETDGSLRNYFTYEVASDGTATITGLVDGYAPSSLYIPSKIDGYSVTSIDTSAFYCCPSLTDITIPNSVTNIGSCAFEDCTSLKDITIPDSVTSIGWSAFSGCTSLASITMSDSVTNIEAWTFYDCTSLTDIAIPNSVEYIEESAFYNCRSLLDITIPNSVKFIGDSAFKDCDSLTSATILNGLKTINDNAFYDCTSLTNIIIPNSVTSIGAWAFYNCRSLTNIIIPNSVTSIGAWAFYNCLSLTNIIIPNSVTSIENGTFRWCSSLTDITIPNGVTRIGDSAFDGCTSLASISIPSSVKNIGDFAFQHCTILADITIPNNVTTIGMDAFAGCKSLINVAIPNSVVSMGSCVFSNCSSLASISIPANVKNIGAGTFYDCTSLVSIIIPNSVKNIGDSAFKGCTSLTNIVIPNSVTIIEEYAFRDCTSLICITVPNSVTCIENNAFEGCSSLLTIYGLSGSFAETYAKNNIIKFVAICTGGHRYDDGVVTTAPTCMVNGEKTYTCMDCGTTKTEPIHALGHTYDDGVIITAPTCTASGEKIYTCVVCGATETETIPALSEDGSHDFENSICTVCGIQEYDYIVENGCVTITHYNGNDTELTIPSTIEGYPVTSIGEQAFIICTSLTSVTIPDSVTSIGELAFGMCASLTEIQVAANNSSYCSVDGVLFTKDKTHLITYPTGYPVSNYTVPNSVVIIERGAFAYAQNLKSVFLPDSVLQIGDSAFVYCLQLSQINLPYGIDVISDQCFTYCVSLKNISIPDTVTSIGAAAFGGTGITEVKIPASVAEIGESAFGIVAIPDKDGTYSIDLYPDFVIRGIKGSVAELYAAEYGLVFIPLQILTDTSTGISVAETNENNLSENTILNIDKLSTADSSILYEIHLTDNGITVQPNGNVTVKIPVPDTMNGADCKVYRQEADGTYTDMQAVYQNGYMVFTTDHFSIYVLTAKDPNIPDIPEIAMGDLNNDGQITAVDARWALQAASGSRPLSNEQMQIADVNGDGQVTAVDARWILQAASGTRQL